MKMQAKNLSAQAKKAEKQAEMYKRKMYEVRVVCSLLYRKFKKAMRMELEFTVLFD